MGPSSGDGVSCRRKLSTNCSKPGLLYLDGLSGVRAEAFGLEVGLFTAFLLSGMFPLGSSGLSTTRMGLGAMGMTAFYFSDDSSPASTEEESLRVLDELVALSHPSPAFIDTAWIYQHFKTGLTNEGLIAKAIAKHGRDKFFIATKTGIGLGPAGLIFDSSPAFMRSQLATSLERLGTTYVDLYYQHRVDPSTPMATVAQVFKELIGEGKIKGYGLSECTPQELRQAHAIHPCSAVQMEYSLTTRRVGDIMLPVCRELGIALVACEWRRPRVGAWHLFFNIVFVGPFPGASPPLNTTHPPHPYLQTFSDSPLGRGLLSKTFAKTSDLGKGDWRLTQPRFSEENLERNASHVTALEGYAAKFGATTAQLALAWLIAQPGVFPIPGTKHTARLKENWGAIALAEKLTAEDLAALAALVPENEGERYSDTNGLWESRL